MIQYIVRRLLAVPIIMLLVTLILFFLMLQLPVSQRAHVYMPTLRASATPELQAEVMQRIIKRYGLDEPFPVQYVKWLRLLFAGEWGYAPSWNQPVLEGLLRRVPASVELALAAMIPSVVLTLALGGLASRRYGRLPDHIIRLAAAVGWAFPPFVLGLMLMNVLYAWLRLFPPERLSTWANAVVSAEDYGAYTGMHTVDALLNGDFGVFCDAARHLVLPGVALALTQWALLTRIMRSSLLEVLGQDYITTARAKGLHERRVVSLHARRNAILPVISIGGVASSLFISQLVVIETIFDFDGIGRAATKAILESDVPAALGFVLFSCLVTVLASLSTDVLYALIDPRVRHYRRADHP